MKNNFYTVTIISIICLVLSISLTVSACTVINDTSNNSSIEPQDEIFSSDISATAAEEYTTTAETTTEENSTVEQTTITETTTHKETTTYLETTTVFTITEKRTQNTTKKVEVSTTKVTTSAKKAPNYAPERDAIKIFDAINDYREENGLNRLALDKELCKLAYIRAQEQEKIQGHTRPNGKPFYSIVDEYEYERYGCGENIVIGPDSNCEEIMNCWIDSPTHNENMLKSKWIVAGIALFHMNNGECAIVLLFSY